MSYNTVQDYFLQFLTGYQGQALIQRLEGVSCAIGFQVKSREATSEFSLILKNGAIEKVEEEKSENSEVLYTTSEQTFFRIVCGELRAERAFLAGKVSIGGNILRGLKLAFLLQEFFDRYPYRPSQPKAEDSLAIEDREAEFEFPEGLCEERIAIPGADLTVTAVYPEEGPIRERVVLVPPHPYLGGTSENALLLLLSSELASRGVFVIRFDYREALPDRTGKGGDVLTFWKESDAGFRMGVEDLKAVHEWMVAQSLGAGSRTAWIGYSYGAQVCLWAQENVSPERQVFISPVASQLGREKMNCLCPTLLIEGTEDFATPIEQFRELDKSFPAAPFLREIEGADHFYTSKEVELIEVILSYLHLEPQTLSLSAEGMLQ